MRRIQVSAARYVVPNPKRDHGAGKSDMDRRERKRLKDEINRGVRNAGIYKVDGDALERENRSPLFKGDRFSLSRASPSTL